MCGIAGYINPGGVQQGDLDALNNALQHRGPDGSGTFLNKDRNVGLAHRRLSIIDLESGSQPMSNEDGTIWITFNGEIYNFKELQKDLEGKHQFRTHSDTEVLLHLYEEFGEKFVGMLRGMFAFGLYDSTRDLLLLARDHFGQKPLYYHFDGKRFLFASEIKGLLAVVPGLRKLDETALFEYLTLRIITPPRSMFEQIKKLPPGHTLCFKSGKVTINRYWELHYEPKLTLSLPQLVDELDQKIIDTVRYHLVSDVEVGAFLSGGLDSSLVVAIMSRLQDNPVRTFSGDIPYKNFGESKAARIVSGKYLTNHSELTILPSLLRELPDLVYHLDEPSDPLSLCMYQIAGLASKSVKVVLGGDGGDELFGGYDRYYGNIYADYFAMLPEWVRRGIVDRLLKLLPDGFWYRSVSHQLRWLNQISFYKGADRYAKSLSYFYFSDRYRKALFTEEFRGRVGAFDPEASIKYYFDSADANELIDKMLYSDSMTRMVDHPVMIQDRMTMAHGLEARSPFLDHRLAEFCARIPVEFKVQGRKRRIIQYELARRYLPPEILERKKQGFSSALTYLLADEFRFLFKTFLEDSRLVRSGLLQDQAIKLLLSEHIAGKVDHGTRLWLLCNAEIWYRMYIEGEDRSAMNDFLKKKSSQFFNKLAA
jgi:asparagine synthase (glutamine-hydrolysing)